MRWSSIVVPLVAVAIVLALANAAAADTAGPDPAPLAEARPEPSRRVATAAGTTPRFFFAGSGRLLLRHGHFHTTLDVRYRHADGTYDADALAHMRHFFRSRTDGREAPISLRLIELLAYVQDRYQPGQMTLLSGYRSPAFNADLRATGGAAARTSLHTQGLAADIAFDGLDIKRLWEELRALSTGGVGYYRSGQYLHIDTGPPRFWEETTSRVSENLSAGNARVFVRTDFDRYSSLAGAMCTLHSVTAFPLRVAPRASLVGAGGTGVITLAPASGSGVELRDGCLTITAPAEAYRLQILDVQPRAAAPPTGSDTHARVVLRTCQPRVANTPAEIESNPIDVTPLALENDAPAP